MSNPYVNVSEIRISGFKVSETGDISRYEKVVDLGKVLRAGDTLNVSFNVTEEGIGEPEYEQ